MWCKNCNIETNASVCPVCNATTSEDVPVEVFWCSAFAEAKLNIWLLIYGRFFLKNDFYLHYCWIKNPLSI